MGVKVHVKTPEEIAEAARRLHLSHGDLAEMIGVARGTIQKVLSGKPDGQRRTKLLALQCAIEQAEGLGCAADPRLDQALRAVVEAIRGGKSRIEIVRLNGGYQVQTSEVIEAAR
jgi:predicted transcriptional regulator